MRNVLKKTVDGIEIEVEYDEREYSKAKNDYYIEVKPEQDFLIEGSKLVGFNYKYKYSRTIDK